MKNHRTNYTQFHNQVEEKTKETVNEVIEETVEQEPAEETLEEAVEQEPVVEEEKSVIGIVTGCKRLRVRTDASTDAVIITEIDEDSVVVIDMNNSTDDFYKVHTEAGAEGWCMRKFVKITS